SAARPLSAKSPRGRFWMKRMIASSTATLPSTAPATGSKSLLTTPRLSAPTSVPMRLPTPPKTTTRKLSTIYIVPRVGLTLALWATRHPADARDARAQAEGQRVDARGRDSHRRGHVAVLRDRAHVQAEVGLAQQEGEAKHHHCREA